MMVQHWWQRAVIYQIYVRSFQDSNDDGDGDIPGIIQRLDYLQALGVDALWLTPIHPSPWADLGYDVSDYTDVHPRFGNIDDLDRLLREAHARDLRVLLDWVPNHTSSDHPWFRESRSSRDNPKRDWYLWADGKPDGRPPSNWISVFGGSAWQWDDTTAQYYCHHFHQTQPDLNWHNPAVRGAMLAPLHFWLKRGVDGFRIDATSLIVKDPQLRDNPPNPLFQEGMSPDDAVQSVFNRDRPEVHEVLARIRQISDAYPGRVLLGELYQPMERVMHYHGEDRPELHVPLNLQLVWCDWLPAAVAGVLDRYPRLLPPHGWPNWMLSTHDVPRLTDRLGQAQARVAALLGYTLPGTLTLYYGEEIGLPPLDNPPDPPVDPQGRSTGQNRDPVRTPMQWSDAPDAGFGSAQPWLPLSGGQARYSVAAQCHDPYSMLSLHRRLIRLRREHPALVTGAVTPLDHTDEILIYQRQQDHWRLLVVLNFSERPQRVALDPAHRGGRVLLSTGLDRDNETVGEQLALAGDEGVAILL